MELDIMAQPMTEDEQRAFDLADQFNLESCKALLTGNKFKAAMWLREAANVPSLRSKAKAALLCRACELLLELYDETRERELRVH